MGFIWSKSTDNRNFLMEGSNIVAQRINFLHQMEKYRDEGHDIVYTDDSYVNVGHAITRCFHADKTGLTAPISKGERKIIVHAGTKNGFISRAKLILMLVQTRGTNIIK